MGVRCAGEGEGHHVSVVRVGVIEKMVLEDMRESCRSQREE